jgi:hypothetical protein
MKDKEIKKEVKKQIKKRVNAPKADDDTSSRNQAIHK